LEDLWWKNILKETLADSILDMMRKEDIYLDKINKIIDWG